MENLLRLQKNGWRGSLNGLGYCAKPCILRRWKWSVNSIPRPAPSRERPYFLAGLFPLENPQQGNNEQQNIEQGTPNVEGKDAAVCLHTCLLPFFVGTSAVHCHISVCGDRTRHSPEKNVAHPELTVSPTTFLRPFPVTSPPILWSAAQPVAPRRDPDPFPIRHPWRPRIATVPHRE